MRRLGDEGDEGGEGSGEGVAHGQQAPRHDPQAVTIVVAVAAVTAAVAIASMAAATHTATAAAVQSQGDERRQHEALQGIGEAAHGPQGGGGVGTQQGHADRHQHEGGPQQVHVQPLGVRTRRGPQPPEEHSFEVLPRRGQDQDVRQDDHHLYQVLQYR
jgi:hypothetical protein